MPPRYAYWTILIDGTATAFRAREREELVPTFNQLARKNADIAMKYFARGKLWDTPEQAQWAARNLPREAPGGKRSRDWRPGGQHKDPRARFLKPKDRSAKGAPRFPTSKASGDPQDPPKLPADSSRQPYVQPRDRDKPRPKFEPRPDRTGEGTPKTRHQPTTGLQRTPPSGYVQPKDRRPLESPYVQPKDRRTPESPYVQPKDRRQPETRYVQPKDRRQSQTPHVRPKDREKPAAPYVQPKDRAEHKADPRPGPERGRRSPPPRRKPR
ncbi:MAG TPA: hypothetical protein VMZ66_07440 [Aeromicrobium sp.]|nr:hypothetical protein [Aeromicrobium sp.]